MEQALKHKAYARIRQAQRMAVLRGYWRDAFLYYRLGGFPDSYLMPGIGDCSPMQIDFRHWNKLRKRHGLPCNISVENETSEAFIDRYFATQDALGPQVGLALEKRMDGIPRDYDGNP